VTGQPVIGAAATRASRRFWSTAWTSRTRRWVWRARGSARMRSASSRHHEPVRQRDRRLGCGALSIVTKSGTNDLHGSAFAFFRDDAMRAQGSSRSRRTTTRASIRRHDRRPIAKDRTHFFASFEQMEEDSTVLFRPQGATFGSLAADLPVPVSQSLFYAGVDHRINDQQNFRASSCTSATARRTSGPAAWRPSPNGMRLDRTTGTSRSPTLDGQQRVAQPVGGADRPAEVRRAE